MSQEVTSETPPIIQTEMKDTEEKSVWIITYTRTYYRYDDCYSTAMHATQDSEIIGVFTDKEKFDEVWAKRIPFVPLHWPEVGDKNEYWSYEVYTANELMKVN